VQVCAQDAQYTYAINFSGRGYETQISTFFNLPLTTSTCVFCGQCVGVCPTGALKPKKQWLMEQGMNSTDIMSQTRRERSEPGRRKKRKNAVGGE
jgi:predicted molibdopterin-dependent oxidoreductase YjgC